MTGTTPETDTEDLYRIGTVSRLTGISPECLRAWERRHGLSPRLRQGRTRFYDHEQVQKLSKIKALIEQGHPISSLAGLSMEQLNARLSTPMQSITTARLPLVGLVGTSLLLMEQQQGDSESVEVCQRWVSVEDFLNSRPSERAHLDVLAVHTPSLSPDVLGRAAQAAAGARLLAVYQFAVAGALEQASELGFKLLRWPITWQQLIQACAAPGDSMHPGGRAAPRRYSDHELLSIAQAARLEGVAEAGHLVDLINQLNGFCEYLTQAMTAEADEGGSKERVREQTCFARAQLEQALQDLVLSARSPRLETSRPST